MSSIDRGHGTDSNSRPGAHPPDANRARSTKIGFNGARFRPGCPGIAVRIGDHLRHERRLHDERFSIGLGVLGGANVGRERHQRGGSVDHRLVNPSPKSQARAASHFAKVGGVDIDRVLVDPDPREGHVAIREYLLRDEQITATLR